MDRKKFVKNSVLSLGVLLTAPVFLTSCEKPKVEPTPIPDPGDCVSYPSEVKGPYPIKTPADWIRENIIGDRLGVALHIIFSIENINDNCKPLVGATIDLWHCDAQGNYSEYAHQVDGDFSSAHFLRGRQTTNAQGIASFITIYPGWYPGRAPHTHLEIKDSTGKSLLVTQTAFPENISNTVYATPHYNGTFDTPNMADGTFADDISRNMSDSITGNITDGYTMLETIKVTG